MSRPSPADPSAAFDLESVAGELRAESAYLAEGHTARTLIRTADMRIVLVALRAGKTISEHHANVTVALQTLSGQLHLKLPDRGVDVPARGLVVLGRGVPHDVSAPTDSTFLLTLGWPAAGPIDPTKAGVQKHER